MILRTDTIGRIDNPTEVDIKKAVFYADNKKAYVGDFVNVLTDVEYDGDFLSISLNVKDIGHSITLKVGADKITCTNNFNNKTSRELATRYLHGDVSWIHEYNWKDHMSKTFLKNLKNIVKKDS